MGHYVNNSLIKGEQVVYEGHYHWFFWVAPVCWTAIFGIAALVAYSAGMAVAGTILLLPAIIIFGCYYLKYTSDEMVVTNRRLVLKTGVISRDTFELQLQKVESVGVDQTFWGRIFSFGTITGTGTGGSKGSIKLVSSPLAFRKAFQEAAAIYDEAWRATAQRYEQQQPTANE